MNKLLKYIFDIVLDTLAEIFTIFYLVILFGIIFSPIIIAIITDSPMSLFLLVFSLYYGKKLLKKIAGKGGIS